MAAEGFTKNQRIFLIYRILAKAISLKKRRMHFCDNAKLSLLGHFSSAIMEPGFFQSKSCVETL
jgi:hypothetical protein